MNLYYKSLRRNKVQTGVTSAQEMGYLEDESISTYLHQVEQRRLYDEKLKMLDTSCRDVLAMFFNKISMKEIARKLGTSEQYAKKKKFNCKSKLIDLIRQDAKYEELIN
ncbi:MAG: sigma-70 family RNA polymerase sigma factor [Saprospiraceae bacterium]|nr:sigma-70 family RNA polymerase sigma factor [Saprospiraceae bacterium]